MAITKPTRRMTLLELLVHTEKYCHDLREQFRVNFWPVISELRDMSRPVRKRSHFPTMFAMQNGLKHVDETAKDLDQMVENMLEWLTEILEHAHRAQKR